MARPSPNRGYVFGVGLNKTGTRSLADALRELGFRTMHRGDVAASEAVRQDLASGRPPLSTLGDQFDAYLDVQAIVEGFVELDRAYPGSRFILTVRDEDPWLDSRERHVLANRERAARGEYDGGWDEVDRTAWREERRRHHERVRAHFRDRREQLLEYDVGSSGWGPLAAFLGTRPPSTTFPHRNRGGQGTYRPTSLRAEAARVRRLATGLVRRVARRVGERS